jgi:hypothetical protein
MGRLISDMAYRWCLNCDVAVFSGTHVFDTNLLLVVLCQSSVIPRYVGLVKWYGTVSDFNGSIPIGPITDAQLVSILPFNSSLAVVSMTGAYLYAALMAFARGRPFLHVAGAVLSRCEHVLDFVFLSIICIVIALIFMTTATLVI